MMEPGIDSPTSGSGQGGGHELYGHLPDLMSTTKKSAKKGKKRAKHSAQEPPLNIHSPFQNSVAGSTHRK